MKIAVVVDQYGGHSNGTTAAAKSFVRVMRSRGHEVFVITADSDDTEPNAFMVKPKSFPGFNKRIRSHGMIIAKKDAATLRKAFLGMDLVYVFLPFYLAKQSKQIADEMGIPAFISFHLPPEHITQNIGLGNAPLITHFVHLNWRKTFNLYKDFHVPSEPLKKILKRKGYKSKIHVVSNGFCPEFTTTKVDKPEGLEDKFIIVTSGRLAKEKRHEVIIKAIAKSKYSDKIQLIICGTGSRKKYLEKFGTKMLTNMPIVKYCKKEELIQTFNYADLYVHASMVEAESIACMEAFATGKVPIISNGKFSAAAQFVLDKEKDLFNENDSKDLAEKIDFYIENPVILKQQGAKYAEHAKQFHAESCADKLENILKMVIEKHKQEREESAEHYELK